MLIIVNKMGFKVIKILLPQTDATYAILKAVRDFIQDGVDFTHVVQGYCVGDAKEVGHEKTK